MDSHLRGNPFFFKSLLPTAYFFYFFGAGGGWGVGYGLGAGTILGAADSFASSSLFMSAL